MQAKLPTQEQLAALTRFATKYGRTWKSKLGDVWMDGNYHGTMFSGSDAYHLQQIRNQFGPSWLVNFRLPKEGK
jgi:hypothetical protein